MAVLPGNVGIEVIESKVEIHLDWANVFQSGVTLNADKTTALPVNV